MASSSSGVTKVGSRADRLTTVAVLGAASIFFALSAYNASLVALQSRKKKDKDGPRSRKGKANAERDASGAQQPERPAARPPSDSAVVNMTYVTTPEDCQATSVASSSHTGIRPKIHAGALFRLIDVAAGVAARRHAQGPCLTISVDSVLLLKPIFLGDIVHVSASVNRAWSTSMEVGVRIVKETVTIEGRIAEYVSHAYLTFVAVAKPGASGETSRKPLLAPVLITSRLESRRHMLAGRRRNKRLEDAKHGVSRDGVSMAVKGGVRHEVAELLRERAAGKGADVVVRRGSRSPEQDELIRIIEMEVAIQAWAKGERGVSIQNGLVEIRQEGDEPLRFSEAELRRRARSLQVKLPGDDGYDLVEQHERGVATPTEADRHRKRSTPKQLSSLLANELGDTASSSSNESTLAGASTELEARQTLTSTMHLVFPQHTNSHGVIFGGNTMAWSEDVAIMATRSLQLRHPAVSSDLVTGTTWKTVAMDGLEFNVKVGVGELMTFTAIVVRTFARSCEVYVMAHAESLEGKRRFTNDVLFTLACDDDDEDDPGTEMLRSTSSTSRTFRHAGAIPKARSRHDRARIVSSVAMPEGTALHTFAAAADIRRQQRLELRDMLVRVYGS